MGRLDFMSTDNQELQWVEQLAKTLSHHQLHKLEFETENVSLTLRAARKTPKPTVAPAASEREVPEVEEADVTLIRSKDVGLFRTDASLSTGDKIEKGQKLGAIEAISVHHDLISSYSGSVVEVMVNDGDPVEYGQPLFVLSESEG